KRRGLRRNLRLEEVVQERGRLGAAEEKGHLRPRHVERLSAPVELGLVGGDLRLDQEDFGLPRDALRLARLHFAEPIARVLERIFEDLHLTLEKERVVEGLRHDLKEEPALVLKERLALFGRVLGRPPPGLFLESVEERLRERHTRLLLIAGGRGERTGARHRD